MLKHAATAIFFVSTASAALAAPADPPTLIKNVAVFDGERAVGVHSVLIRDGKIADPDFKGKMPDGASVVDGKGKTLLPGLIDAHVHQFGDLEAPLLFGVTTELDMFSPPQANAEVKARSKTGANRNVADLFSAGILATVPGGHGTEYGFSIPTLTKPGEADAWVAARVAEGSDYIKIINEDGATVGRKLPTLDLPTMKALVTAAHKHNKLAVVHVQSYSAATDAINAGADGLVHMFLDKPADAAFVQLAKSRKIFISPTITVFEAYYGKAGSVPMLNVPALSGLLKKQVVQQLKQAVGADRSASIYGNMKVSIPMLAKAGVPLLAGTDSGNPATYYGISLHHEIDLLVASGLSPAQALSAATANVAKAYRLSDRGRITKGLKADLLLVDGDPTKDITAIHNIVEVWMNGAPASELRAARRTEVLKELSAVGPAPLTLPADGRISSFSSANGKAVMSSAIGSGWSETTDTMIGGSSTLAFSVAGASPSGQPALMMTGEVKPGAFAQWAGIGFMPGTQPFAPANISAANALKFFARGEGPGFGVMAFSTPTGQRPVTGNFTVSAEWKEVTVKFSELKGFDPASAMMLTLTALKPGPFKLEVADVRLVKE